MKRAEITQIIQQNQQETSKEILSLLEAHRSDLEKTLSDCLGKDKTNIENALKSHRDTMRKLLVRQLRDEVSKKMTFKILSFKVRLTLTALLSLNLIVLTLLTLIIIMK